MTTKHTLDIKRFSVCAVGKCREWPVLSWVTVQQIHVQIVQPCIQLALFKQMRIVANSEYNTRKVSDQTITEGQSLIQRQNDNSENIKNKSL